VEKNQRDLVSKNEIEEKLLKNNLTLEEKVINLEKKITLVNR
jgi:hypothetical protein